MVKMNQEKLKTCVEIRSSIATCYPYCILPGNTIQKECWDCPYNFNEHAKPCEICKGFAMYEPNIKQIVCTKCGYTEPYPSFS